MSNELDRIETPALVVDRPRMTANIARLRGKLDAMNVALRPHVKTNKCLEVTRAMCEGRGTGITVSTLREAEFYFAAGETDILYAVAITPAKLDHVADLTARGADMKIILDSVDAARIVVEKGKALGVSFKVLIEIDSDGHRSGLKPGDPAIVELGELLTAGSSAVPVGVMTHAGGSYGSRSEAEIIAAAEQERRAVVDSAEQLRAAGLPVSMVSVGSTPTALFAEKLDGVTEVRAGVYVFQDLVMAGIGVCRPEEIALSVLACVIGHQPDRNWIIVDAGWMALSRDRGTASQPVDQGYGLVTDVGGDIVEDLVVSGANQEHGIISDRHGGAVDWSRYPVGTYLRILPNHACATAGQHDHYLVTDDGRTIAARWERTGGW